MRTIDKIITKVDTSRGAPMGRSDRGTEPIVLLRRGRFYKADQVRVYDSKVKLTNGYDTGGAYWGIGAELRVSYTKDLSYIHFYRKGE